MRNFYFLLRNIGRVAFLVLFLLVGIQDAWATHALGADLSYTCIGPNQYSVTLNVYRDCRGINLSTPQTISWTGSCGSGSVAAPRISRVDISPLCSSQISRCSQGQTNGNNSNMGVEKNTFVTTITVPPSCTNITFYWTLCCRNNAITTLNNPGGQNLYIEAMVDNTVLPCNNSPSFTNPPLLISCVNDPVYYNPGVVETDGDSLVYSLINCLEGSGNNVNYNGAFSGTSFLGASVPISINPATGDISFTPIATVVTVVCIRISEYRNGLFIGSVTRDIQYQILNCNNPPPILSGIDSSTNYTFSTCYDAPICFDVFGIDANGVSLSIANMPSGANFNSVSGATIDTAIGTFCWTANQFQVGTHQFTIIATDNACPYVAQTIKSYTINILPNPSGTVNAGTDISICNGDTAVLTATTTATNVQSYLWTGSQVLQPTNAMTEVAPTTTSSYTIQMIDTNNCTAYDTVIVTVGQPSVAPTGVTGNTSVCSGGSTTLTVSGGTLGAGAAVEWFSTSCGGTAIGTGSSIVVSPTVATSYFVRYNGPCNTTTCASVVVTVSSSSLVLNGTKTNMVCPGVPDGTATGLPSGGTTPYTYLWNNGQTTVTITGLSQAAYALTVTDAGGCTATKINFFIFSPAWIVLTKSSTPTTCTGNDGTATIGATGGTGSKTYLWSNGQTTTTATGLAAGTYGVTATDANGCEKSSSIYVGISPICASISTNNLACNGVCNGIATAVISGGTAPYTYYWSLSAGNATTISVSGLCVGTYWVSITDAMGASLKVYAVINEPTALTANIIKNNLTCSYICDGSAEMQVSGPGAPYTYQWDNGQTTSITTGLCQGVYRVTATNSIGCTVLKTNIQIFSPMNIIPNKNSTPSSCAVDGTATIGSTGGTGAHTYLWSTGATTTTITGLAAGNYTVTVTDANGCEKSTYVTVANSCVMRLAIPNNGVYDNILTELETVTEETVTDLNETLRNNDFPQVENFTVFPNPAEHIFQVVCVDIVGKKYIQVFDAIGQLVYDNTTNDNQHQISVQDWAGGIYLLRLRMENGTWISTKLVVQK